MFQSKLGTLEAAANLHNLHAKRTTSASAGAEAQAFNVMVIMLVAASELPRVPILIAVLSGNTCGCPCELPGEVSAMTLHLSALLTDLEWTESAPSHALTESIGKYACGRTRHVPVFGFLVATNIIVPSASPFQAPDPLLRLSGEKGIDTLQDTVWSARHVWC
jgi:hypothetical protein